MEDVTFGHNGPYGNEWKAEPQPTTASSVAIPGRSLMSMCALLIHARVNLPYFFNGNASSIPFNGEE